MNELRSDRRPLAGIRQPVWPSSVCQLKSNGQCLDGSLVNVGFWKACVLTPECSQYRDSKVGSQIDLARIDARGLNGRPDGHNPVLTKRIGYKSSHSERGERAMST